MHKSIADSFFFYYKNVKDIINWFASHILRMKH